MSTGRIRVIYWQNQASPYMVARFNALHDRGSVRIGALFSRMRAPDRDWTLDPDAWSFEHATLPQSGAARVGRVLAQLKNNRPDVFISEYDRGDFCACLVAAPRWARRTAARVLPTFAAWSESTRAREAAKHVVFRSLSAATVSGPEAVAQVGRYGLPAHRTFRMTQSIDVAHYGSAHDVPGAERDRRRAELGLHGCVFVYAGRLWSGKGIDTLLAAYRALCGDVDCSLLLVGTGVDEQQYRAQARDLPGVVFAGFREPGEMPQLYALADVLVLPTLGDPHGLVVEEAMAAGLPVISSSAAGHIRERIEDGVTGFVVPVGDEVALGERMRELAKDVVRCADMGSVAAQRVAGLGHEQWAIDFERFVEGTLRLPRRGPLRG